MKNQFIIILFTLFLYSCHTSPTEIPTVEEGMEEVVDIRTEPDYADWETFWTTFQKAAADDDKATIAGMTLFGNHIQEEFFNDNYTVFFGQEMKEIIAKTQASDVEKVHDMEFPDGRSITYEEFDIDEDGNEVGSALMIYFGKQDGIFKIMMFFAAG